MIGYSFFFFGGGGGGSPSNDDQDGRSGRVDLINHRIHSIMIDGDHKVLSIPQEDYTKETQCLCNCSYCG